MSFITDQSMKEYQAIKCNGCNELYYTPKPARSQCTQCKSENIEFLTNNEATRLFKQMMVPSWMPG